jgi:hypothetical protein
VLCHGSAEAVHAHLPLNGANCCLLSQEESAGKEAPNQLLRAAHCIESDIGNWVRSTTSPEPHPSNRLDLGRSLDLSLPTLPTLGQRPAPLHTQGCSIPLAQASFCNDAPSKALQLQCMSTPFHNSSLAQEWSRNRGLDPQYSCIEVPLEVSFPPSCTHLALD